MTDVNARYRTTGPEEAEVPYRASAKRRLDLVASALLCEMVFGGVVMVTLWLAIMAVFGMVAFVLAVLVAFGAGMWATGLSLYAKRRREVR